MGGPGILVGVTDGDGVGVIVRVGVGVGVVAEKYDRCVSGKAVTCTVSVPMAMKPTPNIKSTRSPNRSRDFDIISGRVRDASG